MSSSAAASEAGRLQKKARPRNFRGRASLPPNRVPGVCRYSSSRMGVGNAEELSGEGDVVGAPPRSGGLADQLSDRLRQSVELVVGQLAVPEQPAHLVDQLAELLAREVEVIGTNSVEDGPDEVLQIAEVPQDSAAAGEAAQQVAQQPLALAGAEADLHRPVIAVV